MNKTHVISEYGIIYNKTDYPEGRDCFNAIYLEEKSFVSIWNFIAENTDSDIEIDSAFSVHRKKGKNFIRIKNYVGVVETKDHTVIEILPKIYLENTKDEIETSRKIFLRMLRHLRNSPFKSIDNAFLKSTRFPILEIFIHTFLEELDILIKRGIKKHYVTQEENVRFLKGSFNFSKQIQHNLLHKERFYVKFDEFNENIPHNRLVNSTLMALLKTTKSATNKIRILEYLGFFENVQLSINIQKDLNQIKDLNRLFSDYKTILRWTRVFLLGESFTNFKGKNLNKAILFPMERIFEDYIGYGFKKYCQSATVTLQEKKIALVNEHVGSAKFKLKPDIIISGTSNFIIDTKWKIIDQTKSKENYKISQADMYQLYAYGKKYGTILKASPKLILLYPQQDTFDRPLSFFRYEEGLELEVIPVDLNNSLEETITLIKNKL
jgi:5-methylcytosine-specific restriction enzyme subunit McrC